MTRIARPLLVSLMGSGAVLLAAQAPVHAQSAAPQQVATSDAIGDIVVTARKRAERAQDTPISISVASAADLENKSITSFPELVRETPSLRLAPAGLSSSSSFLAMRGQFVIDTRLHIDPAIAVYIDGVYQARAVGTEQFGMLDVEQIEILKGPQGTLFGKNSTGGAINISTMQPNMDKVEGRARVRVAEGGELAMGAVLNVPLAPNAAFRVVADWTTRDGYGRDSVLHTRNGHLDSRQIRASFKFEPTDSLSILLRGDYAKSESTSLAFNGLSGIARDGLAVTEVMTETGLSRDDAFALLQTFDRRSQDSATEARSGDRARVFGYSAEINLDLNDNLSLKSITAMRYIRKTGSTDPDGTPFQILEYPYTMVRDHQFSQELQLSGTAVDNRLNYILGGYFANEKGTEVNVQRTLGFLSAGGNGDTVYDGSVQNKTFGVFAQGTFKLTDSLSATGGVRYTKDWRDLTSRNRNNNFCLALGQSMAAVPVCEYDVPRVSFDHVSYTASLEYKPTNDILIYVKTSDGYRTGALPMNSGSPLNPITAAGTYKAVNPETITDYEIGIKADWFDRRLRTNIAAYHGIYKDIQRVRPTVVPGTTQLLPLLENIAKAKIDGIEAQVIAQPFPGLELKGAVDYIHARYTDYMVGGVDLSDTPLAFTPKWSYNLSAAYTVETGIGPWRTQVDYSHQSKILAVPDRGFVEPYGLLNARTSLTIADADLDLSIFARNLTKETYYVAPADVAALGFIYNSQINPPRVFGFEATKRF